MDDANKYIKISWKHKDYYDDMLPLVWFSGAPPERLNKHGFFWKGKNYGSAECSIKKVNGLYRLKYKKSKINKDVDLGETIIGLSTNQPRQLIYLAWKDEKANTDEVIFDYRDDPEFYEGGSKLVLHVRAERSYKLIKQKKLRAKNLNCEICEFNFREVYGEIGEDFCEVHHDKKKISEGGRHSKLSDLAILCANCHRMIHRTGPEMWSVEDFKEEYFPARGIDIDI